MNLLAKDFWFRVKNLCKELKITRDSMAIDCKIPIPTVKGWANKGIFPNAEDSVAIAKHLNTTVEYLVTGKDAEGPKIYANDTVYDPYDLTHRINSLKKDAKDTVVMTLLQQIEFWENH